MEVKCLVISERPDEYTDKRGKLVKQQLINVIDQSEGIHRLVQPIEHAMSEEEKTKYAGKLQGRTLTLGVHEFLPFGGRLKCRGQIVSVDGIKNAAN
jgi:hypothetical protein